VEEIGIIVVEIIGADVPFEKGEIGVHECLGITCS